MKLSNKKINLLIISLMLFFLSFIVFKTKLFDSFSYALSDIQESEQNNNNNNNLYFPDISKRTEPNELLVMVFLYDDYTGRNEYTDMVFNMTDEEIKAKYYNEIFGSGNIEAQTWSVNDFYKENSKGKFYFKPIELDGNTTGVYPIRMNKVYDKKAFEDIKYGFESLMGKGLTADGFNAKVFSGTPQQRHILCVFPTLSVAHVGTYPISEDISSNVATIDYRSNVYTMTHELGHTLELWDLYYQREQATLMSGTIYPNMSNEDIRYPGSNHIIPSHIDPLQKITLGWATYEVINKNTTITLYPTTSDKYNPIIVSTKNNEQYYIIENRNLESFESQNNLFTSYNTIDNEDACCSDYAGINIWRIDKLGFENLRKHYADYPEYYTNLMLNRRGNYIIGVLKYEGEQFSPKIYSNISDSLDFSKHGTNIMFKYLKLNSDGSVDISINLDDKPLGSSLYKVNNEDMLIEDVKVYEQTGTITKKELLYKLNHFNGKVYDQNNNEIINDDEIIKTGMIVKQGDKSYKIIIKGDCYSDGKIYTSDIIYLRRYLSGMIDFSDIEKIACDADNDGVVDITDVIYIRRHIAGGYDWFDLYERGYRT